MKAVFSKTTTDQMKSKILSPKISQLVFDVYISPMEFAALIEQLDNEVFEIKIDKEEKKEYSGA